MVRGFCDAGLNNSRLLGKTSDDSSTGDMAVSINIPESFLRVSVQKDQYVGVYSRDPDFGNPHIPCVIYHI